MKFPLVVSFLVASGVIQLAAPHSLRSGARQNPKDWGAVPQAAPAPAAKGALGAVMNGGGDFYTKQIPSENLGDVTRGSGSCTAWRRTLECNPSGPRDPKQDKSCQQVIMGDESGYCECGNYAQFAAVDCDHRAFTCEVMCLKFAVVTGRPATFNMGTAGSLNLSPQQAKTTLAGVMHGEQDLSAMKAMSNDVKIFMDRAKISSNTSGKKAKESVKRFLDAMNRAQLNDAKAAAAEMEKYRQLLRQRPSKAMADTGKQLTNIGKELQAIVNEVIPIDASSPPKPPSFR